MATRRADASPPARRAAPRTGARRQPRHAQSSTTRAAVPGAAVRGGGALYGRADLPPAEPRAQGRPPRGADDAEQLVALCAELYLREWKAPTRDLRPLYDAPQLRLARERHFAGRPDATERALLLLRWWLARYCGDRAERNALALGRGGDLRQARVAGHILVQRLRRPDLTRQEEAAVVGRALGLAIDISAHRRAVDAMFDALRRYGPDLLRDLAWTTSEHWQHYEECYGIGWDDDNDAGPRPMVG